jgi:hypothetical protein
MTSSQSVAFSVASASGGGGGQNILFVDPILLTPSSTGTAVHWATVNRTTAVMEYGLTTSYGQNLTDNSTSRIYDGSISGLTSSSTYYYRITMTETDVTLYTQVFTGTFTTTGGGSTPSDTTAPTVSLTAPASGTVSGSVTASATASDAVGIAGVQFLLDGSNLGTEDTTSPYSISWDTTTTSNASHTVTARARDAAGNTTTSSGVTVTVSNTVATPAPTVSISASPTSITAGNSSTLTWSSTNATTCTASGSWSGTQSTSGTLSVSPSTTSTYTLSCTGTGGATQQNTTVTVSSAPSGGTGSPFFQMDYSAGAFPLGGWTSIHQDYSRYTRTYAPSIGPSGQNGYRLTQIPSGPTGGDNYWNSDRSFTGAPFVYGDNAYLRWRFRWIPGTDCRAYHQDGSGGWQMWRNKILILNDGEARTNARFVLGMACGYPQDNPPAGMEPTYLWSIQKDGGVDIAETTQIPVTTNWQDIQVEIQYSSASNVADGGYRLWVNNNNQNSPTIQRTGIIMNAHANPGFVRFGAYFNNNMRDDGHLGWEHVDFQIDDDFDSTWDN